MSDAKENKNVIRSIVTTILVLAALSTIVLMVDHFWNSSVELQLLDNKNNPRTDVFIKASGRSYQTDATGYVKIPSSDVGVRLSVHCESNNRVLDSFNLSAHPEVKIIKSKCN